MKGSRVSKFYEAGVSYSDVLLNKKIQINRIQEAKDTRTPPALKKSAQKDAIDTQAPAGINYISVEITRDPQDAGVMEGKELKKESNCHQENPIYHPEAEKLGSEFFANKSCDQELRVLQCTTASLLLRGQKKIECCQTGPWDLGNCKNWAKGLLVALELDRDLNISISASEPQKQPPLPPW